MTGLLASTAFAQEADIFGADAVFIIEATSIEEVDTAPLPAEAQQQVVRLLAPPVEVNAVPLVLPDADFSAAATEVEPNEKPEQAMALPESLHITGTTAQRDSDYFVFEIAGASDALDTAQLWAIEAVGDTVKEIGYLTADRRKIIQRQAQGAEGDEAHRFVLANLLLYAGEHRVWVRGKGDAPADYRLRIVPLGVPDPTAETEPNDDESRAHALAFDQTRSGYLYTPLEQDLYYFNLLRETVVTLRVDPPADAFASVGLALSSSYGGGGQQFVKARLDPGADALEATRRLPPGTYTLRLKAGNVGSANPYQVRLTRTDLNTLGADLEPNDTAAEALPLPPDHRVTGTPARRGEYDYFVLPPLAPGTQVRVTKDGEVDYAARRRLVVHPAGASQNAPSLVAYDEAAGAWTGAIPADGAPDQQYVLRVQAWLSDYAYQVAFTPGPAPIPQGPPAITVEAPADTLAVAAYLEQAQRLKVPLTVTSTGVEGQALRVSAYADDPRWRVQLSAAELALAPGERRTLTLGVTVPADAGDLHPVRITTMLEGPGGRRVDTLDIAAICGVPPVDAVNTWPLPDVLLGGINVAGARFGGAALDGGRGAEDLLDDRTPYVNAWSADMKAAQVTVDLAGEEPVQVRGVALNPRTTAAASTRVRRFRVETSEDGVTFVERLQGELHALGEEQGFAFPAPVAASHVRLTVEDTHQGAKARRANLGEFKVIAEPQSRPLGEAPFNLADPALGARWCGAIR